MDSGSSPPWGTPAARTPPINQHQPSVGTASLGAGIAQLHNEHPHHVQGERLQNKGEKGIHHPVNDVYKGRMTRR